MNAGSTATFTFTGVAVRWIGYKDQWSGIATVTLDGQHQPAVDTYASSAQAQTVVWGASSLSNTTHTITITVSGAMDSSSAGEWVWLNAFAVDIPVAAPAGQTITFAPLSNVALGVAPVTLVATASSGLPASLSSTSAAVCSVSGTAATIVAPGTCSVTASQAGNANYAAATSVVRSFNVTQAAQTITFGPLSGVAFNSVPFTLTATASSGLAVSFSSGTASVCAVSGNVVTLEGAGACSITASQAGNTNYAAGTPVVQGFTVTPATQTITFGALSAVALPASAFTFTATASSGLTVSFASTTTSVCTVSGSTVIPIAAGTCTITASQYGNANYTAATSVTQSFTINPVPVVSSGGGGGGATPGGGSALTASPASVTISAAAGGSPGSATVTVSYETETQGAPTFSSNFNTNQGLGWLSVSPASGTMAQASYAGFLYTYTATVNINGDPTGIAAGSMYTGTVNLNSGGGIVSVPVTLNVVNASAQTLPQLTGGIANAASGGQATPSLVSPGSYVAIYGTALAETGNPSVTSLPLPTTLNGTQATLCGLPMSLLYAGATQINALIPQGVTPNISCPLIVTTGTTQSAPVQLMVAELQPGIYTVNESGSGPGIVTNALTGQLNSASNPAHAGDYLVIYCTGLGQLQGPNGQAGPADGAFVPATTIFQTTSTVTATIGGVSATVSFSGLTPTFAGLYQVNVQVPAGITPGNAVLLVITATDLGTGATAHSNSVTIATQ